LPLALPLAMEATGNPPPVLDEPEGAAELDMMMTGEGMDVGGSVSGCDDSRGAPEG
jgi:hypothetical protein